MPLKYIYIYIYILERERERERERKSLLKLYECPEFAFLANPGHSATHDPRRNLTTFLVNLGNSAKISAEA
jgi:hypothetical protein